MTLLDYLVAGAASWAILGTVGGSSWAFVVTRLKRRRAEHVVRLDWLPPVPHPAPTQADIDATWLDPWPVDLVTAPPQQVKRLFDDLIALEGLQ